jgi:hypothetical protein
MKNDPQNFQVGILMNSDDRFYPGHSSFVIEAGERVSANAQPRTAVAAASQNPGQTWWARSYNQGLPVVGGRYIFLRGAWLPGNPCNGWNVSASWGTCAPNTGEAC